MLGLFVTGTGTGVGKSIVAAALCATLLQQGRDVVASKPLLSGLDELPESPWPHDHELLALITGADAHVIAPCRFGPAVSPHLAARLQGVTLDLDEIVAGIRSRHALRRSEEVTLQLTDGSGPLMVVEGAGGLLVPIDDAGDTMAGLARALDLPLLIAAHPGLGTINHVMLTLEAARARALDVAAVVLTPWPAEPGPIEADNRVFLEREAGVPVLVLERVDGPDPTALAAAGLAAGLHRLL